MNRAISVGLSIAVAPALLLAYGLQTENEEIINGARIALFGICLPVGAVCVLVGIVETVLGFVASRMPRPAKTDETGTSTSSRLWLHYTLAIVAVPAAIALYGVVNGLWDWTKRSIELMAILAVVVPIVANRPPTRQKSPLMQPNTADGCPLPLGRVGDDRRMQLTRKRVSLVFAVLSLVLAIAVGWASSRQWGQDDRAQEPALSTNAAPASTAPKVDERWLEPSQLDALAKEALDGAEFAESRLDCPDAALHADKAGENDARRDNLTARDVEDGVGECAEIETQRGLRLRAQTEKMNETWRPILVAAANAGDPIAEMILRVCSTLPTLDRSGLPSDCSPTAGERETARRLIETHPLPAARAAFANPPRSASPSDTCPAEGVPGHRCRLNADIQTLLAALATMETGYLSAALSWLPCEHAESVGNDDPGLQECRRLYQLMKEVVWTSRHSYSPGLLVWSRFNGGIDSLGDRPAPPEPESSPPPKQSPLAREARAKVAIIEDRIAADLKADPRWKHFVHESLR